jgi:YfiH family protein
MGAPTVTSELRQLGGLDVLTWPAFRPFEVDVIVTTRRGGVSGGPYESLNLGLHVDDVESNVLENRRRAAGALGADLGDLVFCEQAHGRQVRVVTRSDRGKGAHDRADAIQATDALVTAEPNVALVVMVADCVPIVLYDPVGHVLACVHAGWRGTVARVCEATVQVMASLGSRPGDLIAGMGPAIAPDRYQVGAEVKEAAAEALGVHAPDALRPDRSGKWLFDLWRANRLVLEESGVLARNIHVSRTPTGSGAGLFFSDREARPCGRFAAIARLRPQERG